MRRCLTCCPPAAGRIVDLQVDYQVGDWTLEHKQKKSQAYEKEEEEIEKEKKKISSLDSIGVGPRRWRELISDDYFDWVVLDYSSFDETRRTKSNKTKTKTKIPKEKREKETETEQNKQIQWEDFEDDFKVVKVFSKVDVWATFRIWPEVDSKNESANLTATYKSKNGNIRPDSMAPIGIGIDEWFIINSEINCADDWFAFIVPFPDNAFVVFVQRLFAALYRMMTRFGSCNVSANRWRLIQFNSIESNGQRPLGRRLAPAAG